MKETISDSNSLKYTRSRSFSLEDQQAFAELSGDYNPIHIDPVSARRLISNFPVVHGAHIVLWSIESCLEFLHGDLAIEKISTVFPTPIMVGETVTLSGALENNVLKIKVHSELQITTVIEIRFRNRVAQSVDSGYLNEVETTARIPDTLTERELESCKGVLDLKLNKNKLSGMFPDLVKRFSLSQAASILCTSRLIGSYCPGMHSLFSGFELFWEPVDLNEKFIYKVVKFNKLFNQVTIQINSSELSGTLKAFVRPPPKEQSSCLTLNKFVTSQEFVNQRALIIGGSRGLGELAAKILASGGADVKFSYNQGKDDADKVVRDIMSNGGKASSFYYNVLSAENGPICEAIKYWSPTHLYYFATPAIFSAAKGVFSTSLFQKFCEFYVTGFSNIINQLDKEKIEKIFYPSSVAIDDLPIDMGEYASAKLAGEMLCDYLSKCHRQIYIHRPRLPRLATDQTASFLPVDNLDPVPILVNELRTMQDI